MMAPIITPRSRPCPSTPTMAANGHDELRAVAAPEVLERGDVKETDNRDQYHCRQNGLGQGSKEVREEQHHDQHDSRRDAARQRRARAPTFVDERLRHPTADRETAAQSGCKVGRGECKKFLIGVETPTVFRGEGATNRGRFDSA